MTSVAENETRPAVETAGRVLVVDDEQVVVEVLGRLLTKAGYEVETAPNGEVALELMCAKRFDVLITDVNMPRMDGHELCAALAEQLPDHDPIIFVLTARPGEGHRKKVGDLPNVEFIEKPASLRALIARIGERLEEQQRESAS